MERTAHRWALVLAAGDGRRLQCLSTTADGVVVPKQYCSFDQGPSLLELALRRAERLVPARQVVVVVAAEHRRWWEPALGGRAPWRVVVQPANKGTAAGVLLPLCHLERWDAAARILILPSDHHVREEAVLAEAARRALDEVATDDVSLILLGLEPERSDTQYGWILPSPRRLGCTATVSAFVEKPELVTAQALRREGGLWNSFVLAASVPALRRLYRERLPALHDRLRRAVGEEEDLAAVYEELPVEDFSRHLLERVPHRLRLLRVPPCGWSDLGTPERVAEVARRSALRPDGPRPAWPPPVDLVEALGRRPAAEGRA